MQLVSSRIWTRVAVSISYNDNHYPTGTSYYVHFWRISPPPESTAMDEIPPLLFFQKYEFSIKLPKNVDMPLL